MEINAIEIIAGFLVRNRKLRLVDQALDGAGIDAERVGEGASCQFRKIRLRQALQTEIRAARLDRHRGAIGIGFHHHFAAIWQFAHDFVQQMRRHSGRTGLLNHRSGRLIDLQIKVGRLHVEVRAFGAQKHVRQDGNCVAPLNDAMDMVEGLQKICTLNGDTHGTCSRQDDRRATATGKTDSVGLVNDRFLRVKARVCARKSGCFQHNSGQGNQQVWRVASFYPRLSREEGAERG